MPKAEANTTTDPEVRHGPGGPYDGTRVPYACTKCGKQGVKLWREVHGTHPLWCLDCGRKDQVTNRGALSFDEGETDQLGHLLPAVPGAAVDANWTYEKAESMYGYSSVPDYLCKWWAELPPAIPRHIKWPRTEPYLTKEEEQAKKEAQRRKDDYEDEEVIKSTAYVVEATSDEQQHLWLMHHTFVEWKQRGRGIMRCIGNVGKHEVWVTVFWNRINDRMVAFIEGTSNVVDHQMIRKWADKTFPCLQSPDHEGRSRWTNSTNFAHCLHHVAPLMNDPPAKRARYDRFHRILMNGAHNAHETKEQS